MGRFVKRRGLGRKAACQCLFTMYSELKSPKLTFCRNVYSTQRAHTSTWSNELVVSKSRVERRLLLPTSSSSPTRRRSQRKSKFTFSPFSWGDFFLPNINRKSALAHEDKIQACSLNRRLFFKLLWVCCCPIFIFSVFFKCETLVAIVNTTDYWKFRLFYLSLLLTSVPRYITHRAEDDKVT